MDLQDTSDQTPLQQITQRVSQQLHGRGILAPDWLVQAIVEQQLAASPSAAMDVNNLDAAATAALSTTIAETVITEVADGPSTQESIADPAVLDFDEAGRLITALGVTTHCALINANQLQPALGAILGRTASCMMTIGSAVQDAYRAGDSALLLPAGALELARQALSSSLTELHAGRWTVVGGEDARTAVLVVLQDTLSRLITT
ncbi:hypothetical protein ACFO1B_54940 [Dactylosporangium siamense]|uniref:Uncharacterized protein n=1 Tax=Dactylosporangium siamense TaxID=685454 RepID=A0A919PVJ6_9ACTN|nr:hypothetical protein [Dactylosporangium siamense]GIG51615.1 hypothetical protein Dsi01nite_096560 [Dactylosporangium siamense]